MNIYDLISSFLYIYQTYPCFTQSTLFNALTESQGAEAANYPFCTIEPNNVRIIILSNVTNLLPRL